MSNKRLLFSLTYYSPYISGLTLYTKRLAEALSKRGYKVSIVSLKYDKKLLSKDYISGVEVIRSDVLMTVSKSFLSFDWFYDTFREIQKCDLVVIVIPQFEGVVSAYWSKFFNKKLISIYLSEVVLPISFKNKIIQFLLNIANLIILKLSDVVVTYNKDFSQSSKALPHFKNKIKYINPPIIKSKVIKREFNLLKKKIGNYNIYKIGFIGRMAADKGIEYLLESIPNLKNELKNFKILIAGPTEAVGEKVYRKKIFDLINQYKDDIILLGQIKDEQLGAFYSLLDVLVVPSINSTEAFGMVQVEAMMMGVPVIASDLPGVRIPIKKTGMGRVIPIENSTELSKAIINMLLHKEEYIKNRNRVFREFGIDKTVNFYDRLFKSL